MRGVNKVQQTPSGNSPSVPINIYDPREYVSPLDFNTLPEHYKRNLEVAICSLLDPDSGKVILTGDDQSGKTFFGAQIIYSAEKFLKGYSLGNFFPLRITRSDYNEFAPFIESIGDYLQKVADEMEIEVGEICVFTDHTEVAGRIAESGTGARIVLEAPAPMFMALSKAQGAGMTSVWSGWDTFDLSNVYLRRRDLVEMVYAAQKDRLNDIYSVSLKKKHIVSVANALMGVCSAIRNESGDPKDPYVMVIPSYVAIVVRKFIQILSSEDYDQMSNEEVNNAIERAFTHTSPTIDAAHRRAHYVYTDEEGAPEGASDGISADFESSAGFSNDLVDEDEIFRSDNLGQPEPQSGATFKGKFRSINTFEKNLKKSIIGQDRAISKVVDSLAIPAAGMHSADKPLRTFLFLGPTGVGKTELSLKIAENLFTDKMNVIRLDMSEYATEGATTSLFGSTPGYIGYSKDGGMLTREVAKNPNSLIILDEIEKAKPSTWDAFLQVLDAARMTTGSGKVVDFSKCVIVMTSNLGTKEMTNRGIGFGELSGQKSAAELDRIAKNALKGYFKVEFLNRIDEIVVFDKLTPESARKIVEKELVAVGKLIEPRGHSLAKASDDILDSILHSSDFDQFGAREIQRTISRKVSVPLAKLVLSSGKNPKKFKLHNELGESFAVSEA